MNKPILVDLLLSLLKKSVENQKNDNMNKYNKENNQVDLILLSLYFNFDDYDEFITFDSFGDINSKLNNNKTNFDFETLDYFKDLKEGKACLYKKNNKNIYREVNSKVIFLNFLQELISSLFPSFERLNILLTYDAYMIFNSTLVKINCSGKNLDYIKINKILILSDQISIQNNFSRKLLIDQIKYIGIYYSSFYIKFLKSTNNPKNVVYTFSKNLTDDLNNIQNEILKFEINKKEKIKIIIKNLVFLLNWKIIILIKILFL